jgi:uncharacterized membrane protein YphA (DoxX/SURF4 family)
VSAATIAPPCLLARFDELLGRPVSMRSLALLRVLVGPIVLWHLWPFLSDTLHGHIYRDAFWEPYAAWYPDLPRALYIGLLWLAAVAAVAMTLGVLTRLATATTFAIVTYNLFLSTTHFHNNRAYLVIVLGVLAVAPAGDGPAPAWPLWLLRFECSAVYAASGISKLLDPNWFDGTVSWMRTVQSRPDLDAGPLPGWVISILTSRDFHTGAAKFVIATELFIAFGLWLKRTRYAAVWVAVVFHVSIQLSAAVEVFSVLGIAVLVIWATPSTRDRVVRGARWSGAIGRLDWLARFRIEPGDRLEVVDRDGTVLRGAPAAVLVLSRLPVTAWFALPARLYRRR